MHHQNKHVKIFFFEISPIETNTDAIQVQVANFAKNSQKCFYLHLCMVPSFHMVLRNLSAPTN